MGLNDLLIAVASWEDRCWLGFQRNVEKLCPAQVLLYFFREYVGVTEAHRHKITQLCQEKGIYVQTHELAFGNPASSWMTLYNTLTEAVPEGKKVVVDLSTMPRETIWTVLDLLEEFDAVIQYVYHSPKSYNKEWLSRDPGRPRLVYKLAGEAKLGLPMNLLILTGSDVDRVKQLMTFFEPQWTFLGLQVGDQFGNRDWKEDCKREFGGQPGIELFHVDAYGNDHGFRAIEKQLEPHLKNANIVMSSLGPKLSAIALYQLHKKYPETALAYAPSNEINLAYSLSIGETFMAQLHVEDLYDKPRDGR